METFLNDVLLTLRILAAPKAASLAFRHRLPPVISGRLRRVESKPHLLSIICCVPVLWNQTLRTLVLGIGGCQSKSQNDASNNTRASVGGHRRTFQCLQATYLVDLKFEKKNKT